jgi:hypothetical protein
VRSLVGELLGDLAFLDQVGQGLVHGLHPEPPSRLHDRVDLVDLPLPDQVAHGRRADQHLARDGARSPVGGLQQLLSHDALEGRRELHPHLLLLVRREHVDDPVDRLRGVLRVQGGEHQVARLGGGDSGGDGLQVPHLPHQDHVGVLPQHVLEGLGEAVRVRPHLTLVHDALLMLVQELDRIFHGHDVCGALPVHDVHHARQAGGLP